MASQGKGAKQKGSAFERKVAKMLTEWWQKGNLEGEFYRTPASGGLRWQKRDDTIGDICTPGGFTQTIECKNNESWSYKEIVVTGELIKTGLYAWWRQACQEAQRANKFPWLVITKNFQPNLIFYAIRDHNSSFQVDDLKPMFVKQSFFPVREEFKMWSGVEYTILESFLKLADPHMFLGKD